MTGSHRSGSTWVGACLDASPSFASIREPFNPNNRLGWLAGRIDRWFEYVGPGALDLAPDVERMAAMAPPLARHLRSVRTPRHLAANARDLGRLAAWRLQHRRLLVKDPIAFFSSEWLADELGFGVVVLVRHPAAFAGSLKRLSWAFDFKNLTDQPALVERYLEPFAAEIERAAAEQPDIVGQATLLWRIFGAVADRWRTERPDFTVVRYEDLAADPVPQFEQLYGRQGVDFGPREREAVLQLSAPSNGTDVRSPIEVRRDSRRAAWTWLDRLSAEEIERIRHETADVAGHWYGDHEWERPE